MNPTDESEPNPFAGIAEWSLRDNGAARSSPLTVEALQATIDRITDAEEFRPTWYWFSCLQCGLVGQSVYCIIRFDTCEEHIEMLSVPSKARVD